MSSLMHHGVKNITHTSIGGTMYVENKKLILGDSSYLEHHGIKGQRWGVRRFQNRDGSLTSAGKKRLGYAANTAGDAFKKTFKAGVKAGAAVGKAGVRASVAAAKGAKSLHDSSKAKRIEKKKQKVSKTRSGVYANKDLFSMEELRSLNAKFDEQDRLKMDKLKKGMEIAKFVAAYAGAVKGVGDAYQSVTGENMLKTVTTMKENKKAEAKKISTNKNEAKKRLQENVDRYRKAKEEEGRKIAKNKKLQQYIDMYDLDKQQRDAEEAARKLLKNYKLQQYIDQYNASLTHDALRIQNGRKYMQHYIENGTLFIDPSGQYLEHHGVKGMKWGKHLMAGKGEAGAGGGAGEDDEKLKEMAEKAGMTIAEYKAKIGGKLGAAKDKVANAIDDAAFEVSYRVEDAADAITGRRSKQQAERYKKEAQEAERKAEDYKEKSISESRYKGEYGNLQKSYASLAAGQQEKARNARKQAKEWEDSYNDSLAVKGKKAAEKTKQDLKAIPRKVKKGVSDKVGEAYGTKHKQDWERQSRLAEGDSKRARALHDQAIKKKDDAARSAGYEADIQEIDHRYAARKSKRKYESSIAGKLNSVNTPKKVKKKVSDKASKIAKDVYDKAGGRYKEWAQELNPNDHSSKANTIRSKYEDSLVGRYDSLKGSISKKRKTMAQKKRFSGESPKAKKAVNAKKKRAKHFDDTNAIYTEGTKLVITSKWG